MKKILKKHSWTQRAIALALAVLLVAGYLPTAAVAANGDPGTVTTVADPSTLTRPDLIYGENTLNAGKVTVGKSVTDGTLTLPEGELPAGTTFTPKDNNFLVTISQSAQVMGLSSESSVPVDVVFVLDTSSSMSNGRSSTMVTAANTAIKTLMEANDYNRIGVVAFSSYQDSYNQTNGSAAEVLSALNHYDDSGNTQAASSHLRYSNGTIYGRGTGAGNRPGVDGGTNIHAGIALGAQMLANATTTVEINGETVTRMPFLVVLSDGQPTFSSSSTNWYNPSMTAEQGPGNNPFAGNGFLAALTAAYYKGKITEHYYGDNASEENRCYVYTIGVGLNSLSGNNRELARITMDPKTYFKSGSQNSYYSTFNSYWNSYNAATPRNYSITISGNGEAISSPNNYTITKESIEATRNFVLGKNTDGESMYDGGLVYNDDHFAANETTEINKVFTDIVTEIQKKAITSPTHVSDHGADFSGYVTFTDPLGEYMEVKDMKGIVANGHHFQGASAARHLSAYGQTGNANNDPEFDALLKAVMQKRLSMTESQSTDAFITAFANAAIASENQAWWRSNTEFDNSIVWWGSSYPTSEEDEAVQILGFADNDSVAYIEEQTAAGTIPAEADYVCRSYFYYGTAGDTITDIDHEYLYFVVRVQRELTAPYKQTVVISAPASLLSVSEAFITEETDDNGDKVYSAEVTHENPARVIYEVGLRSDINAQNVEQKISAAYKAEKPIDSKGSVNYDPTTDTYYFFTNDWDRNQTLDSHHRAMAKATFDAAADNAFYTFQQDTTITDANGNVYKGDTKPTGTWYYVRPVYDWSNAAYNSATGVYENVDTYDAYIKIDLAADAGIEQAADGSWFIHKGVYAASALQVNGDDAIKTPENVTGTAATAAHPHRTGSATNSHYTVLLGNNGRLALVNDPPKTVSITQANGTVITDGDGKTVMVGDELTYTIKVVNNENAATTAVVTDTVPKGTKFVSATPNVTPDANGKLTWNNVAVPANGSTTVSFVVEVLPAAIAGADSVATIDNTAIIDLANAPAYTTNTTTNPPEGKKVAHENGNEIGATETLKVGDTLTYYVRAYNDTGAVADVTITDIIPVGTTYVAGTADHGGTLKTDNNGKQYLEWVIEDVQPGNSVVVSFDVVIDASAKINAGGTQPEDGTVDISNDATIKIGPNDPAVDTNSTVTKVKVGDITLHKTVASGSTAEEFTLRLTEADGKLTGTYVMTGGSEAAVTFTNGIATVKIRHDQTLTIKGLPEGTRIDVAEDANAGWTPSYSVTSVTVSDAVTNGATVTNRYSAQPAHFQIQLKKDFEGNVPAGNFAFDAVEVNVSDTGVVSDKTDPIILEAVAVHPGGAAQDVIVKFTERSFSTEFTRYYRITERTSSIPGVQSDITEYLVKLTVSDNGEGQLVAQSWLATRDPATGNVTAWNTFDWQNQTLSFTNVYPDDVSAEITGTKVLDGRYIQDKEFTFELVQNGQVIATNVLAADSDSATEAFKFVLNYTASDMVGAVNNQKTFNYQVREVKGSDRSITYSTAVYDVAVTVTFNRATGELETVVDYDPAANGVQSSSNVVFNNSFESSGTSLNLTATKTLVDGDTTDNIVPALTAGQFSFGVYEGGVQIAGGTNDANGNVSFAPIGYTAASMVGGNDNGTTITKEFTYTVKENVPAADAPTYDHSIAYSSKVYNIVVTVTYNKANGSMSAAVTKVDGATSSVTNYSFSNTKYPENVSVVPEANKTTNGVNVPENLRFSFSVVNAKTGVEAATGISAKTDGTAGAKNVEFTSMVYDYNNWLANRDSATSDTATFYYWIQESNTAQGWVDAAHPGNGVDYDETRYLMKVVLTYNNGKLSKAVTYYLDPTGSTDYLTVAGGAELGAGVQPSFTNTYYAAGFINLTAGKTLTGRALEADEFDFHLKRLGADDKAIVDSEIVGVNAANGIITFGSLNFSANDLDSNGVGTVRYVMTEINPGVAAIPGVKYSEEAYIVTIGLQRNAADAGKIDATVESVVKATVTGTGADTVYTATNETVTASGDNNTGATFTNTYTPSSTSVTISAGKSLTGRELNAGEFGFELYRVQWNATTGVYDEFLAATTTNQDADSDHVADDILFTRTYNAENLDSGITEFTVTYVMKETQGSLGGVTYTGDKYYVQVDIIHNVDSAQYYVGEVRYYTANKNPLNANDGAAVIYKETYAADGQVTRDGSLDNVVFANAYTTNEAYYTTVVEKQLLEKNSQGTWVNKPMTDGQFSFSVVEINSTGTELNGGRTVAAGTNGTDGTVSFGRLTFSHNATHNETHYHYFKITEDQGSESGITYDSNKAYYLKVTIHDDSHGNLTVTKAEYFDSLADMTAGTGAIYTEGDGNGAITDGEKSGNINDVLFTNRFGPGYLTINPNALQKIVKVTNGNAVYELKGSEFDFDLYASNGTDLVASGTNGPSDAQGVASINFGSITYTSAQVRADGVSNADGTYTATYVYIAKERALDTGINNGVSTDTKQITLIVAVTDDGYGNLTADIQSVTDSDGVAGNDSTFTNQYTATPTSVEFTAHKTLVNKTMIANEFSFELKRLDTNETFTLYNDADGNVATTAPIVFTAPGEYTFTMRELTADSANYDCDESVYTIKVNVTDDLAGNLHAVSTYYKDYVDNGTNTPVSGVEFTNTYKPSSISVDLSAAIGATKSVVDPDGNVMADKVSGFDFEIVDVSGNVIATGESNERGEITFPNLTFSVSGEYHYRIREAANADKPGYNLDQRTWETYILVRYYNGVGTAPVVNNAAVLPGSLYIVPEEVRTYPVSQDGTQSQADEAPAFVNTYAPTPVSLTLTAAKELVGRDLRDNEFTFRLMEGSTIRAEATNAADGTVSFRLNYTMPGNYSYVIHEHIPEAAAKLEGVTYDQRTYNVNITVKDVDGKLVINGDDDGEVTLSSGAAFLNSYKPGATTATIMAQKTLTGKTLKDGDFSFELLDKDNNVIDTVTNDGAGNVVFVVDVPEAGTYTYTVREKAGSDDNVTYDTKSYKVTVKAEQNAAAKLVTTVTYDTAGGVMPTFENTYTPDETSITLTGTKTLTGRTMTAGEFKFQVHDSVGTLVATGTNDAEKNIIFDAISLPVVGRYELTVTEVNAGAEGMTYDDTKFVVTVDVTNKNGVLEAVATYPEGGIVFANTYEEKVPEPTDPDVPDTGDHAQLGMWITLLVVSSLCVCAATVLIVIPTRKGKYEK